MNRSDFIVRIFRYILFGLLSVVAAIAGSRVVSGASCSNCPGKGVCIGEADCSKYLPE
jgi:hypothetical protein